VERCARAAALDLGFGVGGCWSASFFGSSFFGFGSAFSMAVRSTVTSLGRILIFS